MAWPSIETQRLVFWKKIPQAEQKLFAPCGCCFARFISSKYNATNIYWRGKYILLLVNCLRKPTPKGKNNSTHLIQWMKEHFYCLLFPLEVSAVLFGINMYYFTEKNSVQRPKSKFISLCCVFNSFCTPKVHIFYAFKVSTLPVGLSVCIKSRAQRFQYHAIQCCCNEIIKTT